MLHPHSPNHKVQSTFGPRKVSPTFRLSSQITPPLHNKKKNPGTPPSSMGMVWEAYGKGVDPTIEKSLKKNPEKQLSWGQKKIPTKPELSIFNRSNKSSPFSSSPFNAMMRSPTAIRFELPLRTSSLFHRSTRPLGTTLLIKTPPNLKWQLESSSGIPPSCTWNPSDPCFDWSLGLVLGNSKECLVGGWTNPLEKYYSSQNGFIFPNFRGENKKIFELPPPSSCMESYTTEKLNMEPKNWWFPIGISFSRGLFSGAMLVFWGVFPSQIKVYSSPLKLTVHPWKWAETPQKETIVFQPSIFRSYISFREGNGWLLSFISS